MRAKDGLVMLRTFQTLKNVVFTNGNFAQFFDKNGKRVRNGLFVYENGILGGTKLYHGDLNGDGTDEKIMAFGQKLEIFNSVGGTWFSDYPFGRDYQGGLRVTVEKLSDSPEDTIIVSQDKGGQVVIYNYHGGVVKEGIFPLGKNYKTGLSVVMAKEKNKAGKIVVGASGGKLPEIIIYDNKLSKISKRFFADSKKLKGELNLAVGDVNGYGAPEIIAVLNSGVSKQIKIYNLSGKLLYQFKVSSEFSAGVAKVGAADVNFDGVDEVVLMNGQ